MREVTVPALFTVPESGGLADLVFRNAEEAPTHPDTEASVAELRMRVETCGRYLDSFVVADFEGASSRIVELPFHDGMLIDGMNYLLELAPREAPSRRVGEEALAR